jgi:hypothetical protein
MVGVVLHACKRKLMEQKVRTGAKCLSIQLGYDFDALCAPYKDANGYTNQMVLPTVATKLHMSGTKTTTKLAP